MSARESVVLLLDARDENTGLIGIRFPNTDAAYEWEDDHLYDASGRGVVRLVSPAEALRAAKI